MKKLISIDIFADFGMLKKPDTNQPIYLTFNMLHKPALLGIFGAIIGEKGFQKKGELPDYYIKLNQLKIGIEPLNHENGNYQKSTVKFNNATGFGNLGEEKIDGKTQKHGATDNIVEQFLIAPAFKCYVYFDGSIDSEIEERLYNNLKSYQAEYIPYLGKNEHSVWWKNFKEDYIFNQEINKEIKINSIYIKESPFKDNKVVQFFNPIFDSQLKGNSFSYFERLPVAYDDIGNKNYQYKYESFAFTDWTLETKETTKYLLLKITENEYIQVF